MDCLLCEIDVLYLFLYFYRGKCNELECVILVV